jgi:hypothetical protein
MGRRAALRGLHPTTSMRFELRTGGAMSRIRVTTSPSCFATALSVTAASLRRLRWSCPRDGRDDEDRESAAAAEEEEEDDDDDDDEAAGPGAGNRLARFWEASKHMSSAALTSGVALRRQALARCTTMRRAPARRRSCSRFSGAMMMMMMTARRRPRPGRGGSGQSNATPGSVRLSVGFRMKGERVGVIGHEMGLPRGGFDNDYGLSRSHPLAFVSRLAPS